MNQMTRKSPEQAEGGLIATMAAEFNVKPAELWAATKTMCGCKGASDAHFMALMMAAKQHDLNPMLRQLYLMETKKGVQVVIPIDGHLHLMHKNPEYVSHECRYGEDPGGFYCEITIHTVRQIAAGLPPTSHREYMGECQRNSGPWQSHPMRMLKHKAMSQAVRYAFGQYMPDADEWERAAEAARPVQAEVTDTAPAVPIRSLGSSETPAPEEDPDATPDWAFDAEPAPDELDHADLDKQIADGLFDA